MRETSAERLRINLGKTRWNNLRDNIRSWINATGGYRSIELFNQIPCSLLCFYPIPGPRLYIRAGGGH
jgi:hypothetical protein